MSHVISSPLPMSHVIPSPMTTVAPITLTSGCHACRQRLTAGCRACRQRLTFICRTWLLSNLDAKNMCKDEEHLRIFRNGPSGLLLAEHIGTHGIYVDNKYLAKDDIEEVRHGSNITACSKFGFEDEEAEAAAHKLHCQPMPDLDSVSIQGCPRWIL